MAGQRASGIRTWPPSSGVSPSFSTLASVSEIETATTTTAVVEAEGAHHRQETAKEFLVEAEECPVEAAAEVEAQTQEVERIYDCLDSAKVFGRSAAFEDGHS